MPIIISTWVSVVLLVVSQASFSAGNKAAADQRQFIAMPDEARAIMRQEMLDHMNVLHEILGLLATNNLEGAAEIAENRMGKSSMGKHRGDEMAPGRHMPPAMRSIGWSMHEAASAFSEVAKQGDALKAYQALQKVTGSCVACHHSYRTR